MIMLDGVSRRVHAWLVKAMLLATSAALVSLPLAAQTPEHRPGGEVNLKLPDLNQGDFLGFTGHQILLSGLVVCVLGLLFGLTSYSRVKNLPVHRSMAEISELIYETCKAYMLQQGRFLLILLGFIGVSMLIESLRAVFRSGALAVGDTQATAATKSLLRTWVESLPFQTAFPASGVRMSALGPLILGAAVGILTSLMGVGGGFIMVPVMIYVLRMPTKMVIGTSLFQLLFTTAAVSVMQAGVNHSVDPFLALILILGSVLGTKLGARMSKRLPAEKLRLILALVVVAVAAKMIVTLIVAPSDVYDITIEVR